MDCTDALERMELAAVEPGGLDRLMAGDTADAAAVAGHLAACPGCVASLATLRRSAAVIRDVVATTVDEDLRDRTLAYVRAVGRERGPDRAAGPTEPVPEAHAAAAASPAAPSSTWRRTTRVAGWVAAIAATAVVAVGLTALAFGPARDAELSAQADEVRFLARVSAMTVKVSSQPDAERVALEGNGDDSGSLLFSPSSGELVVTATGLASPRPDREYGCWLESREERQRVGRMRFGGDVAGWAGPVDGLDAIADDAVFRVYLEEPGGGDPEAEPVLWGAP